MLSVTKIGNLDYYLELATQEYYMAGGEPPGVWAGQGATLLGLCGQIDPGTVRHIAAGFTPDGRAKLVQNAGKEGRCIGWDLTFSAPKSVSILWAVAPESIRQTIEKCHAQAVQVAIDYLEEKGGISRTGKGGHGQTQVSFVIGLFEHGTSRAEDPQLHTHALIFNLGVDRKGRTRTILSNPIFRLKMVAGALYRAELAHLLIKELGLRLVPDRFSFRIKGISQKLCGHYSKRRQEVEQKMNAASQSSAKAAEIATLETRNKKEVRPRQELLDDWKRECRELGFSEQQVQRLLDRSPRRQTPGKFAGSSFRKLSGQHSYFSTGEMLRETANLSLSQGVSASRLRQVVDQFLQRWPEAIALEEERWTTAENLKLEEELLATAEEMMQNSAHQLPVEAVEKLLTEEQTSIFPWKKSEQPPQLSWEQESALGHLTLAPGAIQIIEGRAGTGKTRLLKAAHDLWSKQGYTVYGACISGKAARGLSEETVIQSETVAKVTFDINRHTGHALRHTMKQLGRAARKMKTYKYKRAFKFTSKTILVLDEAAMIGTRDLHAILKKAKRAGAKVVLVGDSCQLQPIAVGNPFRSLARRLGSVRIEGIQRQNDAFDKQVVADLAEGKTESAFQSLLDRGLVHLADNRRSALKQLVADWGEANRPEDPIFVPTRKDAAQVNDACQKQRKKKRQLKTWKSFKLSGKKFYVGDRILFEQRNKRIGVENGDFATITKINKTRGLFTAELANGKKVVVPLARYRSFSLGYATTVHKGQGTTVDNAFVLLGGSLQDRFLSYVQMSRARGETRVYVDRFEAGRHYAGLISQMNQGYSRPLASDLSPPPESQQPSLAQQR